MKRIVKLIIVVLGLLASAAPLPAQRRGKPEPGIPIPPRTRLAIDRALKHLASTQNPNGSWTDKVGRKVHYYYIGTENEHIGVTALAGIAFLANGSLPDSGPYAKNIRKALDFILQNTLENGFISAHDSRMYSHAFATLFLAEIYGMTRDPEVREKLKKAVRLIIQSQNKEGGWRYLPGAHDSDMSITVCQVMALRAARNHGIQVPKETIDRAIDYVKKSFRPGPAGEGAFTYQIEDGYTRYQSRVSFALTACGVAALYGAGEYDAEESRAGLDYLELNPPPASSAADHFDYFYGHYYAVQAFFQAGGSRWSSWYDRMQTELLSLQEAAGNWRDQVGKNYATAMAAIILQIPYQYLPITER